MKRKPICYWHFVGWSCISIGMSIDLHSPNLEIHLPFGFFRLGWQVIKFDKQLSFLEELVIDMNKRLQGVEKYICHNRIEEEIRKV